MDITSISHFTDAPSETEDKKFKNIIAIISLVQTSIFLLVYSILTYKTMRELKGVTLERSSVVTILVFLLCEAASLINSIAYVVLQNRTDSDTTTTFKVTDIIT